MQSEGLDEEDNTCESVSRVSQYSCTLKEGSEATETEASDTQQLSKNYRRTLQASDRSFRQIFSQGSALRKGK